MAPTDAYSLSLHDALPISTGRREQRRRKLPADLVLALTLVMHLDPRSSLETVLRRLLSGLRLLVPDPVPRLPGRRLLRSEEHTSELQSQSNLVCRLLLEKK